MNNHDRNIRTLIVCFIVAVFSLVPLRFVELGRMGAFNSSSTHVLGETVERQVILPNDKVDLNRVEQDNRIEAPYNKSVSKKCIPTAEADNRVKGLVQVMTAKELDKQTQEVLIKQIEQIATNKCK